MGSLFLDGLRDGPWFTGQHTCLLKLEAAFHSRGVKPGQGGAASLDLENGTPGIL